jgi:hypothetical protein
MRVITIRRTVSKAKATAKGRFILEFARHFFATENHLHAAIEALVFGALLALCAWPIVLAAGAIDRLL